MAMVGNPISFLDKLRSLRNNLISRRQSGLYEQFVLFGDSLTEFSECQERGFGFAPALRDDYIRRLDVVNRGESGYNTDLALKVLPYVIPSPSAARVRILVIFFGANDSCFPQAEKNQCVPLPVFKKNIIKMIQHPLVVAHSPRIMLITPPPIDERKQIAIDIAKGYGIRRSAENTKQYADAVKEVGKDLEIPVCDIWSRCMEIAGWQPGEALPGSRELPPNQMFEDLMSDGLHFLPKGYRVLYELFRDVVAQNWPDQVPENLPYILPAWDRFDEEWKGGPPRQ